MRKIILMVAAAILIIPISQASAVTTGVNLLTGGDFEGGLVLTPGPFTAGVPSHYNKWMTHGWDIVSGGQAGATDDFAQHGFGLNLKIVQGINANALGINSGQRMYLKFDYILEGNFKSPTHVKVVGLNSGEQISTWSAGTIEGSDIISEMLLGTDGWESQRHNFIVDDDYDAIAVVFTMSSYDEQYARGIDNINLTAVPEPLTMLGFLMGTGMIGRYLKRRRA